MTGHPLTALSRTLGVSRSTAYRPTCERPQVYQRSEDAQVLEEIRAITRHQDSYGYRRVNRLFGRGYNEKRIRRVMRLHSLQIPPKVRRRTGRAHTGRIETDASNVRWCSAALEIACWNGEIVQVGFALDCCDREALAWVAAPRDLTGEDIRLRCRSGRSFARSCLPTWRREKNRAQPNTTCSSRHRRRVAC